MIFISVGLPGRFAQWCDAVIAQLAGLSGASVAVKPWPSLSDMISRRAIASTLDEVASALLSASDTEHLIVGVRQPDTRLLAALADTNAPFVVSLDHPRTVAAEILAEINAEPRAVTRAVANSCAQILRREPLIFG